MLSRFLNSAKSLFAPITEIDNNIQSDDTARISVEMVTTRQSRKVPSDEDSIIVELPTSSRKRQRKSADENGLTNEQVDHTGSATKKQKKLPVRAKDEETPNNSTRVVVEIPVSTVGIDLKEKNRDVAKLLPKSHGIDETEDSEKPGKGPESIGNDTDNGIEALEGEEDAPEPERTSILPKISGNISVTEDQNVATTNPKHKRFGSEEPKAEFFSTAAEKIDSEDESSDDDAPEIIETRAAQKSVELKARGSAKAIEEQESAIRQKRKQRDAALKEQAKAAEKKRKRGNIEEQAQDSVPIQSLPHAHSLPKLIARSTIPELLPEEYLQDEDPEAADVSDNELPVKKAKKTKFADVVEKKPKDRRKGSTTYRVSEVISEKLAPKASFNARTTKESWLQGRPGKTSVTNRKSFSTGFFKKW